MKTAFVRVRIDPVRKRTAETILSTIGLSPSEAVNMLYAQIVLHKGLPFEPLIPNAETKKALATKRTRKGFKTVANVAEMHKDILGE
jgi:DNA-damage-inducible protein J